MSDEAPYYIERAVYQAAIDKIAGLEARLAALTAELAHERLADGHDHAPCDEMAALTAARDQVGALLTDEIRRAVGLEARLAALTAELAHERLASGHDHAHCDEMAALTAARDQVGALLTDEIRRAVGLEARLAALTAELAHERLASGHDHAHCDEMAALTAARDQVGALLTDEIRRAVGLEARLAALTAELDRLHGRPFSLRDYGAMLARTETAEARLAALTAEREKINELVQHYMDYASNRDTLDVLTALRNEIAALDAARGAQ